MKKSTKVFLIILLFIFLIVFVVAVYKLISYYSAREKEKEYMQDLTDRYVEVVPPVVEDEKETCPIKIDFDSLLKKNPDVCGWIYSEKLSLNYPIVRGKNNNEYLHRSVDKTYLYSGTLFMDSYNNSDFSDYNTVIYGHNMQNGTMFHQIVKYKKQAFYDDKKDIWLLTPTQNYKLEPISGRIVKANDDSYRIFRDGDLFYDFLYYSVSQSLFKANVDMNSVERVVTLSTCTYEFTNARFVLVCQLVECN